jgi:hypothetical protein
LYQEVFNRQSIHLTSSFLCFLLSSCSESNGGRFFFFFVLARVAGTTSSSPFSNFSLKEEGGGARWTLNCRWLKPATMGWLLPGFVFFIAHISGSSARVQLNHTNTTDTSMLQLAESSTARWPYKGT